ncbi:MAG: GldG family protein [Deltaproteobacteria bacterium]|nr:GldG family protein [Deltaproteobacteria bacterium]
MAEAKRQKLLYPALVLLALAACGFFVFPSILGFYLLPGAAGLILLALWLTGTYRGKDKRQKSFAPILTPLLALAICLAFGIFTFLPQINVAAPKEAALDPDTLALLAALDTKISFNATLDSSKRSQGPYEHLLRLYAKASNNIALTIKAAPAGAQRLSTDISVATLDSVVISSQDYSEVVYPITRSNINAALERLISPNRLVYNLMGDGERSQMDTSPRGISLWAEALESKRIYLTDRPWPEGLSLSYEINAVILAGPRMPLGEEKEAALLSYLKAGGKVLVFVDPLVASVSNDFLAPFNLKIEAGLLYDQHMAWSGTDDSFIVAKDFPAHPITTGLSQPVVWPLAGAIRTVPAEAQSDAEGGAIIEDPALESRPSAYDKAPPKKWESHSWAIALTSQAAWLETDLASIGENAARYSPGVDPPGPLVLASATSINGGGRLVIVADSDLISNAFIDFAGNRTLSERMLFWLLGAQDELLASRSGEVLHVTDTIGRLFFWVPVVFWPLIVLLCWLSYFRRRRKLSL